MSRVISFFIGVLAACTVLYFSYYREYKPVIDCLDELNMCQQTLEEPHHCVSICMEVLNEQND